MSTTKTTTFGNQRKCYVCLHILFDVYTYAYT